MLWGARRSAAKERSDFQTVEEYVDYIEANTEEGTRVEWCEPGGVGVGVGGGGQGRVVRNTGDYLVVSWDNGTSVDVDYLEVKLVANRNLLAD